MKLTIKTLKPLKPRNPLVALSHQRLAGAHRTGASARRQQAARALRQEIDHLQHFRHSP